MLGEGYDDSLRLTTGVSSDKTKACIESNVKTVCSASALSLESLAYHFYVMQEAEQCH
jgi:hypothetical protein